MRLYILSDLHLECADFTPLIRDADLTILAGDIHTKRRGVAWAAANFSGQVVYVPGNHEYYDGNFPITRDKMQAEAAERVHVLDRQVLILGKIRILGATGWTDFKSTGNEPLAYFTANCQMRDYLKIRKGSGYHHFRARDSQAEAFKTRDWLEAQLDTPFDGKTLVVTHHAPSERSMVFRENTHLDAAYFNRWDDLMDPKKVALWIHGHIHHAVDYEINGVRVLSNPKGYPHEVGTGFVGDGVVELEC